MFLSILRYIKDLLRKHIHRYILGVFFLLCVDALQLVMPKVLEAATDALESGTLARPMLAEYAGIIALMAVGIAVFRFLFRYTLYGVSRTIELSFRNRFYRHLQKLSANYFNTHKTGDLMAHATNDMNNVTMATGQGVIFAIDSFTIPVVSLVMMWKTAGFRLTAASFAPLLFLLVVVLYFMKIMQSAVQKQQEAFSDLTESARENFSGIRVIKSFAQEQKEIERFERVNKTNMQANLRFIRLMSMMFPSVMLVSSLSLVVAIWYGGILVIEGSLTLGGFVAFNSYLGMLIWPIAGLGWVVNIFQRGSVSLRRINAIMDEKPEIADRHATGEQTGNPRAESSGNTMTQGGSPASAVPWSKRLRGDTIEFRNLTFAYPGTTHPVLKDISVTVEKGKTLAIIGRAGSGKTTLISLIPRLFQVPDGTLFIDGTDINDIPLSVLRSNIACVPQDVFLFSDTIKNNIDFYRGFSMDEIESAAKIARIHDDIMEFPNKYETVAGERGVTLSGGQKQRVAIARALLGAPSILILDDCLSAVDAKTEENILNDLKKLMKQHAGIIVSHRISAVKDADEIIVIDEGSIVERGTHSSLLELNGHYRSLYARQMLVAEIEEVE
ncbi:MAG: ABC transporter ATP-binding protein [Acetivibrionales bacterium]|jgi:ATP-binding cassette subfamily B multidrug efflux pump